MIRRAIAAVVIVIVIVLIAVGIGSCQSSANKSALESYADNVSALITRSQANSTQLFGELTSGVSAANANSIQNQLNRTASSASGVLADAEKLSVPGSAKTANVNLVQALQMRYDGITSIAKNIQPALGTSVSQDAVSTIAGDMARFYASDVLYKQYAAPALAAALHSHGIGVGGANGETINADQFLRSLSWLTPGYIDTELNVTAPASSKGKLAPGPHGHELNTVSFNGAQLSTSGNNVAAKPPPTFSLNFTNSGASNETGVVCKVTVSSAGTTGQKVVPETFAGKTANCAVTLKAAPPPGTYTVVATIEKVPGETNLDNNTKSFPVTFTG